MGDIYGKRSRAICTLCAQYAVRDSGVLHSKCDGKRNKLASAWLGHGEEFQKGNVSRPVGRGRESEWVGLQEG